MLILQGRCDLLDYRTMPRNCGRLPSNGLVFMGQRRAAAAELQIRSTAFNAWLTFERHNYDLILN